jgi:hypothetical protein
VTSLCTRPYAVIPLLPASPRKRAGSSPWKIRLKGSLRSAQEFWKLLSRLGLVPSPAAASHARPKLFGR